MNVIVIFTYGISLKKWDESGILDREMSFYERMSEKYNINYSFITFGFEDDESYVQRFKGVSIYPAYKYIKFSDNKYLNLFRSFLIPFKLKKQLSGNQLIKTNQLNGGWVGIILKKLLKIPLYTRTGYNLYEFSLYNKKSSFIKLFHYLLTQAALLFSDLYSVTSKTDRDFLEDKFKISKNIEVIPNWVIEMVHNDFDKRYENKILTVGRLEKQKNISSLIKSIQGSEIEIDIIGDGSEKESLVQLSEMLNVKVNFLGKLNFKELNNIYKNYRIFILPSLFEGNPKALLESMSNGCLVIAAYNKNVEEIITNNKNGILYNPEDDLIKMVKYYLRDKEVSEKIIRNGYQTIEQHNQIENIMESEIFNYKKLVK